MDAKQGIWGYSQKCSCTWPGWLGYLGGAQIGLSLAAHFQSIAGHFAPQAQNDLLER
jgi:hypothetical protein